MDEYKDPTPWVHRWPNERKGVRSGIERCVVDQCEAAYEPRKAPEHVKKTRWLTRVWQQIRKATDG